MRLLCILAHPDDESLGTGGILAHYAAEGVETYLITATRGEHGWADESQPYPGPTALGQIRETELRAAAHILGVRELQFLDYEDGLLDQANPSEAIAKLVEAVRRIQPQVVVTFGPDGAYGHPDHIAICQFTTAALVAAADPHYAPSATPHRVAKLYYMADLIAGYKVYEEIFGEIAMEIDGVKRTFSGWPGWAITTQVDTSAHWQTVWRAVLCHQSQISIYGPMEHISEAKHQFIWGQRTFYRAYSLVNGGRTMETDLFEGLRASEA